MSAERRPQQGRLDVAVFGEEVEIDLTDDSSHIRFCSVRLPAVEFLNAIARRGMVRMEFELVAERVGKALEVKTAIVEVEPPYGDKSKLAAAIEAVRKLEVDGWMGDLTDIENHHCYTRKPTQGIRVKFHRYVEKETA